VVFVKAPHGQLFPPQSPYRIDCRSASGKRGNAGDGVLRGGAADGFFIVPRFAPQWRIDDQVDFPSLVQNRFEELNRLVPTGRK